jgi:hypothetical protein
MDTAELARLLARKTELESKLDGFEVWLIIFGILVVVGVGGESLFGIRSWLNNRKLHSTEQSIDILRQAEIAQLNVSSETLRTDLRGADTRIAEAKRGAAEATAKAESFRLDIAKANETAERERLARIQLEARLADRTLSPAQRNTLTSRLTPFSGVVADVIVWGDTAEIQSISALVLDSMANAGWKIQRANAIGGTAAVRGILVGTQPGSDAATTRASSALVAALQSLGLDAGAWSFAQLQPPGGMMNMGFTGTAPIRIFIGSKP